MPPVGPASARSASARGATPVPREEDVSTKTPPTRLPRASATAVAPPTRSTLRRLTPSLLAFLLVARVLVAPVRQGHVWERRLERVLVRVHAVGEDVVR